MAEMRKLPHALRSKNLFSRRDFVDAMSSSYGMTGPQIAYDLQKRLDRGMLIRVGWGQYAHPEKPVYSYEYSEKAVDVAQRIENEYDGLDFRVFELVQLNDFINHQIAHNTIFVTIENDLVDFAFDSLWKAYPGRVMLKPKAEQYYRYHQDNDIIVGRLPSESPKGFDQPWESRLEKILVDVFTDKLMSTIVPDGEKKAIIDGAFNEYMLDEKTMLHYARRKGAEKKMQQVLTKYKGASL